MNKSGLLLCEEEEEVVILFERKRARGDDFIHEVHRHNKQVYLC